MIVPLHPAPSGVTAEIHHAIVNAIATRRVAEIEDQTGRTRIGEPHDYGIIDGRPILLFYQTGGYSRSGGLPQWRNLDATGFRAVRPLEKTFRGGRSTETGRHRQWTVLFIRADPT
jgi:hypothetical protein